MQFLIIAYDDTDAGALDRRLAARQAHLQGALAMYERGEWLYASAILNDAGVMAGSMIVCDFPSREAMQKQWLDHEPYITGKVWKTIHIHPAQVAPFCAGKNKQ
ncbi:MAG TPA: YciI family protein [bacterium]|nr:YciI family protein [bacterium]HPN41958.1 YciI family protein [bacterium]